MTTDQQCAREELDNQHATCVLCQHGHIRLSHQTGIRPLVEWLAEDPDSLRGAAAADKIIGKAAALLLVYGGVACVHAGVLSEGGQAVLLAHGVSFTYDQLTPWIRNRQGTGMCPMEQRVQAIDDPAQAFWVLSQAIGIHLGSDSRESPTI